MLGNKVILPSKGFTYGNCLAGGEVEVLPMKTKQEELLAGRIDMLAIINTLIDACVPTIKEKGLRPIQLLSGDRLFLLYSIRKFTYGSNYGFKAKCPSCDFPFRYELNIPDDLTLNELNDGDMEPFFIKLSNNKTEIGFRLLTGLDEQEIDRYRSQAFKRGVSIGDPAYTYTLARHIVTVNGKNVDVREAKEFVDEMSGMDSVIFQDAIREKEPGISRELNFDCKQCGFEIETLMPYSAEFFRPKLRRRS